MGAADVLRCSYPPPSSVPMLRPMPSPFLWDRLRSARAVQVLIVYLGASWVVLQIADILGANRKR